MASKARDDYLFVGALDFGTTYSGYAFSTRAQFEADPLKIQANQAWVSGGKYLLSLKTPTSLLVTKNEEFVSFGYDAENQYADFVMDGEQDEYMFFNRFKMALHDKGLTKDLALEDVTGKKMAAMKIISLSIKALKDHMIDLLNSRGTTVYVNEVRWVLTVPAIWSDAAKNFMRKSAEEAGIPDDCLFIALEPEAASIYCQYLPVERLKGSDGFSMSKVGTKYMVIDLGGGTADITVHEKMGDGKLRELEKASGGACGGTAVDRQYIQSLSEILGEPLLNKMSKEHTSAYVDLFREFETAKRNVKPESAGKINMTIPYVSLNKLCSKELKADVDDVFKRSSYDKKMSIFGDKLRISVETMKEFFKPAIKELIGHIKNIMKSSNASGVSMFLLVGGFSESKLIQEAIKDEFSGMRIIIPEEPGLAVLKGAVIFGHNPKTINSRVLRYTYGTDVCPVFDWKKHRNDKKIVINGVDRCSDVFSVILSAGTEVEVGKTKICLYGTTSEFQSKLQLAIYCSPEANVEYIDDENCFLLGKMEIDVPNPTKEERQLAVQYTFGNTELEVIAIEVKSRTPCVSSFKMI